MAGEQPSDFPPLSQLKLVRGVDTSARTLAKSIKKQIKMDREFNQPALSLLNSVTAICITSSERHLCKTLRSIQKSIIG